MAIQVHLINYDKLIRLNIDHAKLKRQMSREIVEDFTALCWLASLLPNHVRSDLCIKLAGSLLQDKFYTHKREQCIQMYTIQYTL